MDFLNVGKNFTTLLKGLKEYFFEGVIVILLLSMATRNILNILSIFNIPTTVQTWDEVIKRDESWLTSEDWLEGFYCETEDQDSCRSRTLEDSFDQWLIHLFNDKPAVGELGLIPVTRENLKRLQLIRAINDSNQGRVIADSDVCKSVSECQDQYLLGLIREANATEDPDELLNILVRADVLVELMLLDPGRSNERIVQPPSNSSTLTVLAINAMLRDINSSRLRTPEGEFNNRIRQRIEEKRNNNQDFIDGFNSN